MNKSPLDVLRWYGLPGAAQLAWNLLRTRVAYPRARLVRFPCYVRSYSPVRFNTGFTCGVALRLDVFADAAFSVGRNVQVNDYVHIAVARQVTIGDDCLIASKVFISDHDHGIYTDGDGASSPHTLPASRPLHSAAVTIGDRVWIGEGVMILKGVTIGSGAVIAAGAVVTRDVMPNVIAAGVPARAIREFDASLGSWRKL